MEDQAPYGKKLNNDEKPNEKTLIERMTQLEIKYMQLQRKLDALILKHEVIGITPKT